MKRSTDPQQDALYGFEESFPWANHNNCTLTQCRDAIRSACREYGVVPPTVIQHTSVAMSWCIPSRRQISLQAMGRAKWRNRGGKNVATALHEAAHQIVHDLCGARPDDHGPTFCGVYFYLLVRAGWPEAAIQAVAREYKLKWVARPPGWFRRRNARKAHVQPTVV